MFCYKQEGVLKVKKDISKHQMIKNIIIRYLGIIIFLTLIIFLTIGIVNGLEKFGLLIKDKEICEQCDTIRANPIPCLFVTKEQPCKTWYGKNMTFTLIIIIELIAVGIIGHIINKKFLNNFNLKNWLSGR